METNIDALLDVAEKNPNDLAVQRGILDRLSQERPQLLPHQEHRIRGMEHRVRRAMDMLLRMAS
jgi:hypothetical protein